MAKGSLKDIRNVIRNQLATFKMVPGGKEILDNLNKNLKLSTENFEARWTED